MMNKLLSIILVFFSSAIFAQNNICILNSKNVNYSRLDSMNLIEFSKNNGIVNIDSIKIGIQFHPGDFDPNYVEIFETPSINGFSKIMRYLSLSTKYWNNFDSTKIKDLPQFVFHSLDTLKTWTVIIKGDTLNIMQDLSVDYKTVSKIIDAIIAKRYFYSLDIILNDNGDTLIPGSSYFDNPRSVYDKLNYLCKIKKADNRYQLVYDFYGYGGIIFCSFKQNKLIVKNFSEWIN